MELTMKELAVTNMTERQRMYRANYRQRIAGWYNGFLHIAIIYTIGLTALYVYLSNIRNLSWAELVTVPVVLLFCDFFGLVSAPLHNAPPMEESDLPRGVQ